MFANQDSSVLIVVAKVAQINATGTVFVKSLQTRLEKQKVNVIAKMVLLAKDVNERYAHILHVVNATMLEDAYKAPVCVEKVSSVAHVRKDAAL